MLSILLENGSVSQDVMLFYDDIYIYIYMFRKVKSSYAGGVSYGTDANGQLYKVVVCFMIVGLKSNVPYIIRSVPETEIKETVLYNFWSTLHNNLVTRRINHALRVPKQCCIVRALQFSTWVLMSSADPVPLQEKPELQSSRNTRILMVSSVRIAPKSWPVDYW